MSDCMAPTAAKDIPSSEHRPHFAMTAIPSSKRVCYDVCIEPEIGRNTRFSISWNVMTTRHQAEKLWFLISPSSRHFNHKHANYTLDEMHMMSSIGLMDTEVSCVLSMKLGLFWHFNYLTPLVVLYACFSSCESLIEVLPIWTWLWIHSKKYMHFLLDVPSVQDVAANTLWYCYD